MTKGSSIDATKRSNNNYATINQSELGATTRSVATRAVSKKSQRAKKVTSSFGADLSKVYSFDGPDDA